MKQKSQVGYLFIPAFSALLAAALVQPVIYSVVKGINERGFTRFASFFKEY